MSVHITRGNFHDLKATVSGDFGFETSRRLLLDIRKDRESGSNGSVEIVLHGVTSVTSCSIGSLMLISELAGKDFRLRLDGCSSEVHALFGSGMLDRFFPPEVLDSCRDCLSRQIAACIAA